MPKKSKPKPQSAVSDGIQAGEAYVQTCIDECGLTAADIETMQTAIAAAEKSPKVQKLRAETKRLVREMRTNWEAKYGTEYPADRDAVERLAVSLGVPSAVLFNRDKLTWWTVWNSIEGYLLKEQKDKLRQAAVTNDEEQVEWSRPVKKMTLDEDLSVCRNTLNSRLHNGPEHIPGMYRYRGPMNARKIEVAIGDLPEPLRRKYRREV